MSETKELLRKVEAMTFQMVQTLDTADFHDLSEFVYERERMLAALKPEPSAENKESVQRILEQDKLIRARMADLKLEAQRGIMKFQSADKYKQAYDKEYTTDSIFFNKRK